MIRKGGIIGVLREGRGRLVFFGATKVWGQPGVGPAIFWKFWKFPNFLEIVFGRFRAFFGLPRGRGEART